MKLSIACSTLRFGAVAALILLSVHSAAASSAQYLITVNTSSVNTGPGFLDFQFNPGNGSQLATAQILNFNSGGGTLIFNGNSPQINGDVAGTLPSALTFVNDLGFNDYFQQFTYGGFFSFVLSLSGPALDHPNGTAISGSRFGVGLYDGNQNPILTSDQTNGFAGQVLLNLDGSTTPQAFQTATGGASVVTFQELPEPGTLMLAFGSLSPLLLRSHVKARRSAS